MKKASFTHLFSMMEVINVKEYSYEDLLREKMELEWYDDDCECFDDERNWPYVDNDERWSENWF